MANSEGSLIPPFVCSKISKINSARLFEKERSFRIVRRKRWNGALGSGQVLKSATKFDGDEDKPASFPVPRPDSRKFKNTFGYFPKPPDDKWQSTRLIQSCEKINKFNKREKCDESFSRKLFWLFRWRFFQKEGASNKLAVYFTNYRKVLIGPEKGRKRLSNLILFWSAKEDAIRNSKRLFLIHLWRNRTWNRCSGARHGFTKSRSKFVFH